ncbi:MAG TPA: protease inhibitor I42 family protein, partial [Dehalococcoidia bacterium]
MSVRAGQRFTLALPANHPIFNYALLAPPDAAVPKLVETTYLRDTETGGGTGLGGVECWTFEAVAPGHATLAFR